MPSDFWKFVNAAMPEALGALVAAAILALVTILWKRISNKIKSADAKIDEAMNSVTSNKVETGDVTGSVDSFSLNDSWQKSHQGELGKAEGRGWLFKLFEGQINSDAKFDLKRESSAIRSTKGGEFEIKPDKVSYKPPANEQQFIVDGIIRFCQGYGWLKMNKAITMMMMMNQSKLLRRFD